MNVICDYCGKPARFIDSSAIYGKSYGMIYYCKACQAWVGVQRGTDKPLGRLANAELRNYKRGAHHTFDRIWREDHSMTRNEAYHWLSEQMHLPEGKTHIGMFDVDQCKQVISICNRRLYGKRSNNSDSGIRISGSPERTVEDHP